MTRGDAVVGYLRVSTDAQGASGGGLAAQRTAIERECTHRGWRLLRIEQDVASGKSGKRRIGFDAAVAACESGEASAIVVAKLDRLSRSLLDFATLIERSRKSKPPWAVVAIDPGIDLTNAHGKMIANVLASLAEWEREMISERTKSALVAKRAQGVRLGRPGQVTGELRDRIAGMGREGLSAERIATTLNTEGVATVRGGLRWYPSTVRTVLRTQATP